MLFKQDVLERIASGEVTLAFRRWQRPTVKAGGSLRTTVGVLSIDSVEPVRLAEVDAGEARQAGFDSLEALTAELQRRPDGGIYRIAFHLAGEDPRRSLAQDRRLSAKDVAQLRAHLDRLDGGRAGAWTRETLRLIGEREGITAAEIAAELGFEKPALKRRVCQLKELGLTESLTAGYRLSLRGEAALAALSTPET